MGRDDAQLSDGAFWGDEGALCLHCVGDYIGADVCHCSSDCSLRVVQFSVYEHRL